MKPQVAFTVAIISILTLVGLAFSVWINAVMPNDRLVLADVSTSSATATSVANGIEIGSTSSLQVNIYAAVASNGSGEAKALAQVVNGQANAEIRSNGAGRGEAQVRAPLSESEVQSPQSQVQSQQSAAPTVVSEKAMIAEATKTSDWQNSQPLEQAHPDVREPQSNDVREPQSNDVREPQSNEGTRLIVTGDVVNVRSEPNTSSGIVQTLRKGETLTGIERSGDGSWWRVGDGRWVYYAWVEQVTVMSPSSSASPLQVTPDFGLRTPDLQYPFSLELVERHREVNNVVLYAFVHEEGRALDGLYLAITKDGVAVPGVRERSAAVPLGETVPACKGIIFDAAVCAENRIYNLKQAWDTRLMYPDFSPWGTWRVQLVDGADPEGSRPVGPWASFEVLPGQTDLELYVRYNR